MIQLFMIQLFMIQLLMIQLFMIQLLMIQLLMIQLLMIQLLMIQSLKNDVDYDEITFPSVDNEHNIPSVRMISMRRKRKYKPRGNKNDGQIN